LNSDKGADIVNIATTTIGNSLEAYTDEGADRVTLNSVSSALDVKLDTGKENDTVSFTGVSALFNIGVSLDEGNDSFTASAVSAGSDAIAIGGAGTDRFNQPWFCWHHQYRNFGIRTVLNRPSQQTPTGSATSRPHFSVGLTPAPYCLR
jgi:hypothetical protein